MPFIWFTQYNTELILTKKKTGPGYVKSATFVIVSCGKFLDLFS